MSTGPNNSGANQAPNPGRPERVPTGANELFQAIVWAGTSEYPQGMMEDDVHIPDQTRVVSTKDTTPLPPGVERVRIELRYGISPVMLNEPVALFTATVRTLDPSNGQSTLTSWDIAHAHGSRLGCFSGYFVDS